MCPHRQTLETTCGQASCLILGGDNVFIVYASLVEILFRHRERCSRFLYMNAVAFQVFCQCSPLSPSPGCCSVLVTEGTPQAASGPAGGDAEEELR